MIELIQSEMQKLASLLLQMQNDTALLQQLHRIALTCAGALRRRKKILFAGNGGSAADAQHLAAELVCRLKEDRPALAALALTTDTSAMTAISNDYGYEFLFARQIEAIAQEGDVLIAISTSGRSANILRALKSAKEAKVITIGFTGASAPMMAPVCDLLLTIPSQETAKIQECHIMFGHILCALIEKELFGSMQPKEAQLPNAVVEGVC